ncbi:sulfotransferase [Thioclava litoralis]|uniref:Sulfotransferase n=1 Tax=Thioclava litoralis TaxID=3076557 RepID=A0ABZ1E0A0_9RHOB|nr:sulfotransferase [Thioclava sp. FTW29]
MRAIRYSDTRAEFLTFFEKGHFVKALHFLQDLAALHGDTPEYILDLAETFWQLGEEGKALELLRILVERFPKFSAGWFILGQRLMNYGATEEGRMCFSQALEIEPQSVVLRATIGQIDPVSPNSAQARYLKKSLQTDLPASVKSEVLQALARAEECYGSPAKAFGYWKQMNRLIKGEFDVDQLARYVDLLDEIAADLPSADPACQMPKVVFICGMPRSGTTITETLLAQHPDTFAMGEHLCLCGPALLSGLPDFSHTDVARLEKLRKLDRPMVEQLRWHFLGSLPKHTPAGKVLVTKMPADAFSLWVARAVLPDLRILHMERHPMDVGLSNFKLHFTTLAPYHAHLDKIGGVMRQTWRMRDINKRIFGDRMRVQSYRALVEDREAQMAEILSFAGLSAASDTPATTEEVRSVRTASVMQVREGVNTKGLDKWRIYERQLAPLLQALGGQAAVADWEAQDRVRSFRLP